MNQPKIDAVIYKECWIYKCIVKIRKQNVDSPVRLLFYKWPKGEELLGDYYTLRKQKWSIEFSKEVINKL